ncbi:hypothetical protein FB2170_14388 [Maribacter sp. HTCC2170]|nr:hypothetical protein FB2170_14388 [Maribacter sp. HTCC2170]
MISAIVILTSVVMIVFLGLPKGLLIVVN